MIMTRPEDSSITFTKHVWLITPSDGDQLGSAKQPSCNDTFIFRCDIQKCNNFKQASNLTATVSQKGEPDTGTGTSDHGQVPVRLWMTSFTGQPCSVRCVNSATSGIPKHCVLSGTEWSAGTSKTGYIFSYAVPLASRKWSDCFRLSIMSFNDAVSDTQDIKQRTRQQYNYVLPVTHAWRGKMNNHDE
jgi:hypothetical protein